MKKIIILALLSFILLSLAGCDLFGFLNSDKMSVGDKFVDDESNSNGIENSKMEYVSHDKNSLTVHIVNNSGSAWQSGNMRDYELQVKKDGEWYRVEQKGEFANTMEAMIFTHGQELTHTFVFTERYGELEAGQYRVVKNYWATATEDREAGAFYLDCEFTVE